MPDLPDTMHHPFFLPCGGLVPPRKQTEVETSEQKVYGGRPWGSCSGGGGEGRRGNGQGADPAPEQPPQRCHPAP